MALIFRCGAMVRSKKQAAGQRLQCDQSGRPGSERDPAENTVRFRGRKNPSVVVHRKVDAVESTKAGDIARSHAGFARERWRDCRGMGCKPEISGVFVFFPVSPNLHFFRESPPAMLFFKVSNKYKLTTGLRCKGGSTLNENQQSWTQKYPGPIMPAQL
jgi:YD repeat-containing protein